MLSTLNPEGMWQVLFLERVCGAQGDVQTGLGGLGEGGRHTDNSLM